MSKNLLNESDQKLKIFSRNAQMYLQTYPPPHSSDMLHVYFVDPKTNRNFNSLALLPLSRAGDWLSKLPFDQ